MEVKLIYYTQKEIIDDEDFFFSGEISIGPENVAGAYEVYDFNIISIKRLYNDYQECEPVGIGFMLNRGWVISKYFNESVIEAEINAIIHRCESDDEEETYRKIDCYFRRREE